MNQAQRKPANRAAKPTAVCDCNRSLLDVEARKSGLKEPGRRWVRVCRCGHHHYCGDLKE